MAEHTKSELVADATALGIPDAEHMTKAELEDAIHARVPDALGPVVPEGQVHADPEAHRGGKTITGVQPVEASDIPEAGL
jgi:hypothetical protein